MKIQISIDDRISGVSQKEELIEFFKSAIHCELVLRDSHLTVEDFEIEVVEEEDE